MKKIIYTLLATAALSSCGEKKSAGFTIAGQTTVANGMLYLSVIEGNKSTTVIDSCEVKDGKFEFSGMLKEPLMAFVSTAEGKKFGDVAIENCDMTLTINNSGGKATSTLSGSPADSVRTKYEAAVKVNPDNYAAITEDFIAQNPSSSATAYILFRKYSPRLESSKMRELAALLKGDAANSAYTKTLLERADLLDKTAVGKQYVDFSAADTEGNMISLSSEVAKGKWILLDFWASWCGPCRVENPHVVAAFEEYGKAGFTVFGVSLDREKDAWMEAIAKDKLTWTNVSDLKGWNCEPAAMYGVSSIPSNVLISPEGEIVAKNLRGDALLSKLSVIFDGNGVGAWRKEK